jgi:hypothetical protein
VSSRLPRAAVSASDTHVLGAARAALARGHAIDAVVTGIFVAAAEAPGVLFGPVQILVGGTGTGLLAVDGRVQQPGRGLPRPRGFLESEEIPDAARVGAPVLVAALSTALASFGSLTLARVLGPAVELAREISKPRGLLLARIAERGPRALTEARVAEELVAIAGRGRGGLLSERDLEELRPVVTRAMTTEVGSAAIVTVPFGAEEVRAGGSGGGPLETTNTRVIAAADARGQMAVACYEALEEGILIEPLDVVLPLLATPVLRGRTRVRPGIACPSAAPIALGRSEGIVDLAVGVAGVPGGEASLGDWLRTSRSSGGLGAKRRDGPVGLAGVARTERESVLAFGPPGVG